VPDEEVAASGAHLDLDIKPMDLVIDALKVDLDAGDTLKVPCGQGR